MAKELQTQKQELPVAEDGERTRSTRVFVPTVDIFPDDDGVVILADMPGLAEDDIKITLEKDILTIEGFAVPDKLEDYELAYSEYEVGDYHRRFTVPDDIDRDNIEATMSNGVLSVRLHKSQEARSKTITVTAG